MSKNAEGWIRHRGGKCPVDKGVRVDVRYRSGMVNEHVKALESVHPDGSVGLSAVTWEHYGSIHDIMAYRLHKPAEQVAPFIEAVNAFNALAKVPQLDGPFGWRDRITEIDATAKALTTERSELVQKLASEGFALIGRATDSTAVLPRGQWKLGDLVVRVRDGEESGMPLNEPMKITFFDGSNRGQDVEVGGKYFPNVSSLLWHSRPSA